MATFHWLTPIKRNGLQLPHDLPNVDINGIGYENGFDERLAVSPTPTGSYICTICVGIPRRPIILPRCGHLFCQSCIELDVKSRKPEILRGEVISNKCPNCKAWFDSSAVKEFDDLDQWTQRLFKSIQFKCPFDCGFKGNTMDLDRHQSFECGKRKVQCPGVDCGLTIEYEKLKDDHIKTCPKVMIYCDRCMLPVRRDCLTSHDCVDRMAQGLKGIIYLVKILK